MKVTNEMIDPEIRTFGRLMRFIGPLSGEKEIRRIQSLTACFFAGKQMIRKMGESIYIRRSHDDSDLRILVMKPEEPKTNVPGVLWLHGGGYALGAPEMAAMTMPKKMMEISSCIIVSPDYRLSIDAPYPAALEDAYDALVWMRDHAEELGIDDTHLIVGGESAGGGLAAALCLYARDKMEIAISFQMPLYPMLDDRMNTPSEIDNDAPVWNIKANRAGWKMYLGDLFETDDVPAYASPARAMDYSNLPPAVTFVGSIEPFRDETITYFENLQKAGIPTDIKVYEGCYHAFDMMQPKATASQNAVAFVLEKYRYAIENYSVKQIDAL
jgi:acetyl esterase/lipase